MVKQTRSEASDADVCCIYKVEDYSYKNSEMICDRKYDLYCTNNILKLIINSQRNVFGVGAQIQNQISHMWCFVFMMV